MNTKIIQVLFAVFLIVILASVALGDVNFTDIPGNESLEYGTDWDGVQFEAESDAEGGIDLWWLEGKDAEDFKINQTGFLEWVEPLGAGSYEINVSVNDDTGDKNSTVYGLEITKEELVITADDKSKVYGEDDPELTYTIIKGYLQYDDNITLDLERKEGEEIGQYNISEDNLSIDNNESYDLSFNEGTFIIKSLLEIYDLEFDVIEGFGDEDDYWYPFDEIEMEFDIENIGEWDVEDIELEIELKEEGETRTLMDEDDMILSDDDFDLDSEDDKTITVEFELHPDNLEEGETDYIITITATGKVAEGSYEGNETSITESREIEIITDDDFIIMRNINIPSTLTCGEDLYIASELWNIGDDKIEEDEIFIRIYNDELDINEVVNFSDIHPYRTFNINSFNYRMLDTEVMGIDLSIPEDAEEKTYFLDLIVYDDGDMYDSDIYETSEGDKAEYWVEFEVKDCVGERDASITAVLETDEDEVKAGNVIEVKATLTNTGDENTTYIIEVIDNEDFSSVEDIDPSSFTIEPDEEQDIIITLKLDDDAEGDEFFDIKATFNDKEVTQTVAIENIIPTFGWGRITSYFEGFTDNLFIWSIVLLNSILVIAIIIVSIKIATKDGSKSSLEKKSNQNSESK